jgi:hypothetical protein
MRLFIESTYPYPSSLKDSREIADYITGSSTEDVDYGLIEDYFRGAKALLRKIPANELTQGDPDHNVRDPHKERRYAKMPLDTMPPLVVENGRIIDGNHRFRVGLEMGVKSFWCYDVVDA